MICDAIRALLRDRGRATRAEVMSATGCTDIQAGNALGHLLRSGEVYVLEKQSRYGCGPANVYALRYERKHYDASALLAAWQA